MDPSGLLGLLVDAARLLVPWRRVRVEVHVAHLEGDPRPKAFITITNLSARDVEVVRIWFASVPPVEVVRRVGRALPRRLRPEERWETWWELDALEPLYQPYVWTLARVELSSGKVFKSRRAKSVAPRGVVPGRADAAERAAAREQRQRETHEWRREEREAQRQAAEARGPLEAWAAEKRKKHGAGVWFPFQGDEWDIAHDAARQGLAEVDGSFPKERIGRARVP